MLNDGKVDIQANKDGWREGLKYLKSLYEEGLIDKGAFTQNPDALQQQGDNAKVPSCSARPRCCTRASSVTIGPDGRGSSTTRSPATGPKG